MPHIVARSVQVFLSELEHKLIDTDKKIDPKFSISIPGVLLSFFEAADPFVHCHSAAGGDILSIVHAYWHHQPAEKSQFTNEITKQICGRACFF